MKKLSNFSRLCIAYGLLGMMFWYGIEQIFLNDVIVNPLSRGYTVLVFTLMLLILDVPMGILADKWGRKKALMLAATLQLMSVFVMGFSGGLAMYLTGVVLYSGFEALLNGSAEALLYDSLVAEGRQKAYAKLTGRMYAGFLIGAGIANAASGFIAHHTSLRAAYLVSSIPCVLALFVIKSLQEAPYEKHEAIWFNHLKEVASTIRSNKVLINLFLQLTVVSIVYVTICEFGQIYILSFGVSAVALGLLWAIDAVFAASGRYFAHYVQNYPKLVIGAFCVILGAFISTKSILGIGLFWLLYGMVDMLSNVIETEVQHQTKSHVRATTMSALTFTGNFLSLPILYAYNQAYGRHGILTVNRYLGIGAIIGLVILALFQHQNRKQVAV